ncbi:restriction endonuclease subunit S [Geosporobacter ferrireducens]|uniref:restriction endonuclease subunit S n=1 Tax=Geosporobacter ferrireducens TaxID=1424294 RepID=UPI002354EFDF|nr:restriction endonuclease subunit S [Geosporobacter ferrireducens]
MSEWKGYKLGEVIDIFGGGTPKTSVFEYWDGSIPWLSVADFNSGKKFVFSTEKCISELGLNNSSTKLLNKNDIIISARGTVGAIAMLGKQMAFNQSCYGIRAKREFATNDYIYYLLKDTVDRFLQISHGGVFDTITRDTFQEIDILLPPLPEQKEIASVLSSLDDKIDLLHRQNETLEAMAGTRFRKWFVEEVGDDWEEKVITDLFEIRDGTHDSPKQKDAGKPLLTSKHILNNRLDIENAYLISNEDFENVNRRSKVETNDILFSMIGTIGLVYLEQSTEINYCIKNIGLFKTSQNPKWSYYTYLWLKSSVGQEFIHKNRSGSTQEYISLGSLRSIVFSVPHIEVIEEFNVTVKPLFDRLKNNSDQIRTLEKLRDSLLPKLMSDDGEVRVEYDKQRGSK